jgi:septal ring factor EnvC (AmiA/AmiB activator)
MTIATIIAVLGFAIALVALWLVSDVIKKVESSNEKFLRAHLASIREEIRGTDRDLGKLTKSVSDLAASHGAVEKRVTEHAKDFDAVRSRIVKVADDLDLLDRSIPQRFRARVIAPKESEATPAAKAKPTVQ